MPDFSKLYVKAQPKDGIKTEQRSVNIGKEKISYELQHKAVKNINMRIKSDGRICVSAGFSVSPQIVDEFVISKGEWILRSIKCVEERNKSELKAYFTQDELKSVVEEMCKRVYPYYRERGVSFPVIKFRKMVSCWGNCRPKKHVLTFNTSLMYVPEKCIEYVVLHEFTHFLQPNHSDKFYAELEKVCPNWEECRDLMRNIGRRENF